MARSNFVDHGDAAYSYTTKIKETTLDGVTIGNDTKYSVTTSRHQNKAGVKFCDIVLTDVPKNTHNLSQVAWVRGLIDTSGKLVDIFLHSGEML